MEYRQLGRSGLRVSALSLGTMSFGDAGAGAPVGMTDATGAARQIDLCLDAGVNLIDTADVYSAASRRRSSAGARGRRDRVLLATKARFRWATGPTTPGSRATT
jgi:aryl-alcohol dehydrogenase-like predicted oxidoreductase